MKVKAEGLRLRSLPTTASLASVQAQPEGKDFWRVKGTYTASGEPASNPKVVAIAYDGAGKPIEVSTFSLTTDGSPRGQALKKADPGKAYSFSFSVGALGIGAQIKSVKAFAAWDCE